RTVTMMLTNNAAVNRAAVMMVSTSRALEGYLYYRPSITRESPPMGRIVTIVGTRPEIIKMAPVVKALDRLEHEHVLVHSGQHYDLVMDRIFFRDMQLREPDHRFELKEQPPHLQVATTIDRKSTRLNSSHVSISYAVFC